MCDLAESRVSPYADKSGSSCLRTRLADTDHSTGGFMFAQRFSLALLVSICCTLVVATPVAQKGKPPALLDIPGQADLRCAGPAGATTDGVCGDGDSLYVDTGLAGGDAGVQVSLREGDHQFRLRFDPLGAPNRFLTVFIPERLLPITSFECTGNCLAANTGNPISNATVIVEPLDGQDARIQTTMRNSQGNTIAGGPRTLAVSESALIDVLIGFQDPHGRAIAGRSIGARQTIRDPSRRRLPEPAPAPGRSRRRTRSSDCACSIPATARTARVLKAGSPCRSGSHSPPTAPGCRVAVRADLGLIDERRRG